MDSVNFDFWSYLLTTVGLTGFYFAGRGKWWAWWINIGAQGLWITYAIVTQQYGFIAAAIAHVIVFSDNLIKWKKEYAKRKIEGEECHHVYSWVEDYPYGSRYELCLVCGWRKDDE